MSGRVYRNIERRQEWFGLEPFDLLGLGFLGWLLMLLYRRALLWDALILVVATVGLRLLKRGKPAGYTSSLVRFYLIRKPFFSATAPDLELEAHPFRNKEP